ncbi:MAG: Uroporphyrinogen-III C-methyltransferase [Syntrophorhabdus sp. PtaB.Bin047]|nr:MAG: Uroporphyrinogen-III C-methyltransferase [Syntrophorhabdus sp. PtaB.Bin047]
MGKVYLVGAGPGDMKLITMRGLELIRQADVIIYDNLVNKGLLEYARAGAEIIYAGKKASRHELPQKDINALLAEKARQGHVVVRLKGGDPFIFGRGGEEAEHLADIGVPFEIVPGVTSAISAPAYAGIPLTHRDYASTVVFITGHEDEKKPASTINWHELATGPDTLVFLMGMKNLHKITKRLVFEGKDPATPACVVRSGTLPAQKVVCATLATISEQVRRMRLAPPGIIVVGDVIRLREKLSWFERKPLFGKKVAVTRSAHQSRRFGELLADRGAEPVYLPTIDIEPIVPNSRLRSAIDRISSYDAIIFTSVNGASIFFAHLRGSGRDARALSGLTIIAIGGATAAHLAVYGVQADLVPEKFTSEGVVSILEAYGVSGRNFLIPRAEEARDVITRYIRANGGSCSVVPIYRATIPLPAASVPEDLDIITFTSSSTASNFIMLYGKETLKNRVIASIGPVTTATLTKSGINVDIEAQQSDIPGLLNAIESYFQPSARGARA